MPAPQSWQPWAEIDPSLTHGGIPDGFTEQEFIGPRLGDNRMSHNSDLVRLFNVVRDGTTHISMLPGSDTQGYPMRDDMEDVLKALNFMTERLMDRVRTGSANIWRFTHANPNEEFYRLMPVRYPLRNDFCAQTVMTLVGLQVEIAESNANNLHSTIDVNSAINLLQPLWGIKSQIMLDYFDVEVAGYISREEMLDLYKDIVQPGPIIVPTGESAVTPSKADIAKAKEGTNPMQWYPTDEQWTTYGHKKDMAFQPDRTFQPEGSDDLTEDQIPEDAVKPV